MKHVLVCVFFFLVLSHGLLAQQQKPEWKRDTVIAGNKFSLYNNWINAGAGYCRYFTFGRDQFDMGLDFNFHITKQYFQLGLMISGEDFSIKNNYQLHAGYGKRRENALYNQALFVSPSYSTGYKYLGSGVYDHNPYNAIGVYVEYQYTYKLHYDSGIGLTLFVDHNAFQTIGGFRIDLFLSGAFKGKQQKLWNN